MEKIPVVDAVGMTLCHDITCVIPGREKYRAYKKGHVITQADIPKLRDMGKEHIYVWETVSDLVHEDDAAISLARHSAGSGLTWDEPNQGRVNIRADRDGLLKVSPSRLNELNSLDGVIMATLHNNRVVKAGQAVAGTKVIPLTVKRELLEKAENICSTPDPLLTVKPFQQLWTGVVITGKEVYEGRVKDGFSKAIRKKTAQFGSRLQGQVIVPDDPYIISREIRRLIDEGAELVFVTGGMSVDPDDVTPLGIRATGADVIFYGAPVLPGAMFMLSYIGHVPVCGVPANVLFNRTTVFDLILPHLYAGERLKRSDIVAMGHGGLCEDCGTCHYPACSFGKA